jgi:hypothetical protein
MNDTKYAALVKAHPVQRVQSVEVVSKRIDFEAAHVGGHLIVERAGDVVTIKSGPTIVAAMSKTLAQEVAIAIQDVIKDA